MEGNSTLEDSGIWKKEAFAKAKSPSILLEVLVDDEEFAQAAKSMSEEYENIPADLHAEDFLILINSAPEKNGIRRIWERLLCKELIKSSRTLEEFIKNLALIPEVPSGLGNKPGVYYAEAIKKELSSFNNEDSTGFKSKRIFSFTKSLPSARGIRDKFTEFF